MMMQSSGTYLNRSVPTSKEALTVYLPAEIKEALKQMSEEQRRSMAFLAEEAITQLVQEWQSQKQQSESE